MKKQIIILISFALLFLSKQMFGQVQPPSKQQIQDQMGQVVNKLNENIADLENRIADAKKTNQPTEVINQLQQQLDMLKKQVVTMSGLTNGFPNMSNKIVQQVSEDNKPKFTVPKKDDARIEQLPDGVLTDAQLVPFVKNIVAEVEKKVSATDKSKAMELYNEMMKTKFNSPKALANIANTCWLNGYPEIALFIMGKVCLADMSNTNNLNNYASFLTMMGGDHAAIPILQNLNQKYPNNSTILNNLGQAWFGLGDMDQSKKFLDQTIRIYSLHSQANLTNAKICMARGNKQEAVESIKRSIAEDYTTEKERALNDLGIDVDYQDIPFPYPGPAEPLSFSKFIGTIPEYPMTGGLPANNQQLIWDAWRENLSEVAKKIDDEIKVLEPKVKINEKQAAAYGIRLKPYNNSIHNTALRKLTLMIEQETDHMYALSKKMEAAVDTIKKWKDEYNNKVYKLEECQSKLDAATEFNEKANKLWIERKNEKLTFQKIFLGEWARLSLYAFTDRSEYELNIAKIKAAIINSLLQLPCEFEVGCAKADPEPPGKIMLPDFDEMNCTYKSNIFIPPFTTMEFDCNKWKTEIGVEFNFGYGPKVSPYLKFEIENSLKTGRTTKATMEVGGELGIEEEAVLGPLKAETVLKGGVGVELTGSEESVFIKGGAGMNYGSNNEHGVSTYGQISGQVEGRMTWESGSEKIGAESESNGVHFSSSAEIKGPMSSIKIGGGH